MRNSLFRKIAAEGAVLLKNKDDLLPLERGTRVALFGRMQTCYYKSGTGSGGLVHIKREPRILDALKNDKDVVLDDELVSVYEKWVVDHPFDDGGGVWAGEPWFQEEMPLSREIVERASKRNDVAVVIIGRTAGEDHDNADEAGSYRLTDLEEEMLKAVSASFEKVAVVLNVGNIIDLSFMDRYDISALMYVWQGGMEGDYALADLLCGRTAPSGKLTITQARSISDYPSHKNFNGDTRCVYEEDVYVGYRYFETFAKDKVRYPFGFGLTYTTFEVSAEATYRCGRISVNACVLNTGKRTGREVVQVYYKAPCKKLGNPSRVLVCFAKTKELEPGQSQTLRLSFSPSKMASYDDSGVTGYKSSYVLEEGDYEIFVGTSVRNASPVFSYSVDKITVTETLEEVMAPVTPFKRMTAREKNGARSIRYEEAPLATVNVEERIASRRPRSYPFTGDRGMRLEDVASGRCLMEEFIAQLTDEETALLVCGEGMCSPKATPGTVGACGGQTDELQHYGIPVCAVTDGPSGVRLDTGKTTSLLPCGTLLASTWDVDAVEKIYRLISKDLRDNCTDSLLGPGTNIQRHPLCGRNFEYFSEDPLLSGKITVACTNGLAKYNCYSTVKHFACNNQEKNRHLCEAVVSERALREIYLKPFEIAVKEGKNVLIMSSYNPINGFWSASNYDLITTVLRGEWGYDGMVMTDWWAKCNLACGAPADVNNLQAMVRAQNDLYMVCDSAVGKAESVLRGLREGYVTRGEIQRAAMNVCNWVMKTNTFSEYLESGSVAKYPISVNEADMVEVFRVENLKTEERYQTAGLKTSDSALLIFTISCDGDELAQSSIWTEFGMESVTLSVHGTNGKDVEVKRLAWIGEGNLPSIMVAHNKLVRVKSVIVKQKR